MMRWLDLPPVWLAGFLALVWAVSRALPGLATAFGWQPFAAMAFLFGGAALMGLAAFEMARARTTIIPHRQPAALVRTGVFRLSRNPIYLGDMLVLAAAILWTGAVVALPILWVFKRVIEARFIRPEETRLNDAFGDSFRDWTKVTRRWI